MKKIMVGLGAALVLSACATPKGNGQPLETWKNFQNTSVSTAQLGENQSLVVFYRQDDVQGPAVNVYVNSNYQASVLPNAFTPVAVCADKNSFSASYSSNTQFGNRTAGVKYTLPVNQVTYIKIGQHNGQLTFTRMDNTAAEAVVAQLPKENQTLSRVPAPSNCGAPVLAAKSLDANALFAFNKSGYKDILPQGREDIANFAKQVQQLSNVSEIKVSGHTDPMGSDQYNLVLSQKRAETVKKVLQQSGVKQPIEAQGFGKKELVVNTCGGLTGEKQIQCNQPNRRVEIAVYGNK